MSTYGLLGEKLGHSHSPFIHSILGDYEYRLFEVDKDDLESFVHNVKNNSSIKGFNVTIPYKQSIIPFCDKLSSTAQRMNSVNTVIVSSDNTMYGDNTDYYGFWYLLNNALKDLSIKGKKVLILGDGGSAATVKQVVIDTYPKDKYLLDTYPKDKYPLDMHPLEVTVVSRRSENNYGNIDRHYDADIIINTTPVGMYPNSGKAVIDITKFTKCRALFDLIYNPSVTKLMYDAQNMGIACFNGLAMLVAQAKKASELFTNSNIPDSYIQEVIDKVERKTQNIFLIGMPGSGKSTIGNCLAKKLNKQFVDTDDLIFEKTNMHPSDIITTHGEQYFRSIESDVLKEVGSFSGYVIAAGGGVVTKDVNKYWIRQNSKVVFVNRDLHLLSTKDRPLSAQHGLKALYDSRIDNYLSWSDFVVDNNGAIEAVCEEILRGWMI